MSAVALHYEVSGPADAPPLLLGGSLGTNLSMWEPQVRALSTEFRVIAFDQRGHGESPAPRGPYSIADLGEDVVALIDTLGLERASYCGLSIGGMAGIWLGANAAPRIDKLMLLCTAAIMPGPANMAQRAAAVRGAGSPSGIAAAVVEKWFTPDWHRAHPDEIARFEAMLSVTDAEGYASCCEAIAAMDLRDALPRISAPTLVVSAARDLAIPPEHQRLIAETVPGARLVTLDPAAHIASVEQAQAVNELIREHLRA